MTNWGTIITQPYTYVRFSQCIRSREVCRPETWANMDEDLKDFSDKIIPHCYQRQHGRVWTDLSGSLDLYYTRELSCAELAAIQKLTIMKSKSLTVWCVNLNLTIGNSRQIIRKSQSNFSGNRSVVIFKWLTMKYYWICYWWESLMPDTAIHPLFKSYLEFNK